MQLNISKSTSRLTPGTDPVPKMPFMRLNISKRPENDMVSTDEATIGQLGSDASIRNYI
jgi:hypothetical protein